MEKVFNAKTIIAVCCIAASAVLACFKVISGEDAITLIALVGAGYGFAKLPNFPQSTKSIIFATCIAFGAVGCSAATQQKVKHVIDIAEGVSQIAAGICKGLTGLPDYISCTRKIVDAMSGQCKLPSAEK